MSYIDLIRHFIAPAIERLTTGIFAGLRRNGYRVVLVDPPWAFLTRSMKGKDRSPEAHYGCMSIADIKALPIKDLLMKDGVVLMWVIDTHLEIALDIIKAWGLTYKPVGFYWGKTNKDGSDFVGMGYWTRANPEAVLLLHNDDTPDLCLLATTGRPKRIGRAVRRLILSPRREHSRKPEDIHDRIEALIDGPYVEIFARASNRPQWEYWGNEVEKFNE